MEKVREEMDLILREMQEKEEEKDQQKLEQD